MKNVTKTLGMLALVLTLASTATMANNVKNTTPVSSSIELKFIGNVENQPVFELNLANADADEFLIIIRDEYGSLLYTAKAKGTNIVRKFMLNEEMGDTNLYVEVKSKKNNKTETYKISKSYSYKDEPVITSAN
ncbi:MAG TPA: hypothetical protein VGM41_03105 [Chitinophagaceae bacterium]|jgi:hypothetical protein